MGVRGPVPKRSDQRHGHRSAEPGDKAPLSPRSSYRKPAADPAWHLLARRWYLALGRSGQAAFYQPSDWEHAFVWAEFLSRQLESGKPSAMMLAAWDSASARLLVTEGDRRRVRVELEHEQKADPDKDAGVASMKAWRARLAGDA